MDIDCEFVGFFRNLKKFSFNRQLKEMISKIIHKTLVPILLEKIKNSIIHPHIWLKSWTEVI